MKSILSAVVLFAACGAPAHARQGGGSSVGTGNPAAVFCLGMKGRLEVVRGPRGEDANCVLSAWELLRAMHARNLVRPIACPENMPCMPNPAARNCEDIGGRYRTPGSLCAVPQWNLFRVFHHR